MRLDGSAGSASALGDLHQSPTAARRARSLSASAERREASQRRESGAVVRRRSESLEARRSSDFGLRVKPRRQQLRPGQVGLHGELVVLALGCLGQLKARRRKSSPSTIDRAVVAAGLVVPPQGFEQLVESAMSACDRPSGPTRCAGCRARHPARRGRRRGRRRSAARWSSTATLRVVHGMGLRVDGWPSSRRRSSCSSGVLADRLQHREPRTPVAARRHRARGSCRRAS